MPWRILTQNDVSQEILPDESATITSLQGGNLLPGIVNDVVAEVQGNIIACGQMVDQPGLVPDQIRTAVKDIIRWRWFCSLPKTDLQSEFRKAQNDNAEKKLADLWSEIRAGKAKIELPANPQDIAAPGLRVTVRPGRRPQAWGEIGHS